MSRVRLGEKHEEALLPSSVLGKINEPPMLTKVVLLENASMMSCLTRHVSPLQLYLPSSECYCTAQYWARDTEIPSICMKTPAELQVPPTPTAVKSAALAAGSAANPIRNFSARLLRAWPRSHFLRTKPRHCGHIRIAVIVTARSDRPSLAQQPCIWKVASVYSPSIMLVQHLATAPPYTTIARRRRLPG